MKSSIEVLRHISFAALAALALAAGVAGCASMSDPEKSDLPWSQHNSWEDAPNLPPSMINNR
jgi:hypothetical protein